MAKHTLLVREHCEFVYLEHLIRTKNPDADQKIDQICKDKKTNLILSILNLLFPILKIKQIIKFLSIGRYYLELFHCMNLFHRLAHSEQFKKIEEILKFICEKESPEIFNALTLKKQYNSGGSTPILLGAKNGNWKIVKIFVKYGADINFVTSEGKSVWSVCKLGDYRKLLKLGAIPNDHSLGEVVKSRKSESRKSKLLEKFVDSGYEIKPDILINKTVITFRTMTPSVLELLLKNRADINVFFPDGVSFIETFLQMEYDYTMNVKSYNAQCLKIMLIFGVLTYSIDKILLRYSRICGNGRASSMINSFPVVSTLHSLCNRCVYLNKVKLPAWFPRIILDWPEEDLEYLS